MKAIKNIYIILLVSAVILSCEEQLEPVIYNSLTVDNFYNTEDDINNALIGLYNCFSTDWGTSDQGVNVWYTSLYNCDQKSYWCKSMLTTDELYINPTWNADLVNFTWGPSTFQLTGDQPHGSTYAKIRFVARATEIINKIPEISTVPEDVRNKYLAEAKTLRAWLMYVLYDFFGPVNVRLDSETLTDTTIQPRPSKEEYCALIEKDLNEALAVSSSSFPEFYNDEMGNWGRVSKGVARMLLLKLYMHNRQWDKAEAAAMDIMNMDYYELQSNYADVFNNYGNSEVIYAIPCNSASPNWWIAPIFPGNFAQTNAGSVLVSAEINGWYGFWMPWEFYDNFDNTDLRLETIISSYVNTNGDTVNRANAGAMRGPIPMKYTSLSSSDVGPAFTPDMVIFRYAEVLLSLAEAINEQDGPSAEAFQYLNMIRQRAGLS
ncbi:RagB/SusD family nutrient uptake outer membrane protein, partial [Bacteroidota bacterium]